MIVLDPTMDGERLDIERARAAFGRKSSGSGKS